MYTYAFFEANGTLTLLRPVFIALLTPSVLLLFMQIFPKWHAKMLNGLTVWAVSLITVFMSGQLLFYSGILVDELNMDGDKLCFYFFFATAGLGVINILIHSVKKQPVR